jgi:hypothetical protein
MKELYQFINKEKQKKYLEIFMILDEIARKENIISFNFSKDILTVQIGINDYYRIWFNEEVKKC